MSKRNTHPKRHARHENAVFVNGIRANSMAAAFKNPCAVDFQAPESTLPFVSRRPRLNHRQRKREEKRKSKQTPVCSATALVAVESQAWRKPQAAIAQHAIDAPKPKHTDGVLCLARASDGRPRKDAQARTRPSPCQSASCRARGHDDGGVPSRQYGQRMVVQEGAVEEHRLPQIGRHWPSRAARHGCSAAPTAGQET